ncbi:MAG: polysaccharide ABC transporter ATP-binding protein, partial [Planctomycetota bacterium]
VGIIGRNGAGKSTLFKLLSRITEPSEGEAFLHGRVASLLEVGTGFHPELTGRDNIFLSGTIMGMTCDEIKDRFDEIVEFAGVETYLDTPVKRYSSGMYVRLGFAIAAHLACEILIVDEVLAVGDAGFRERCVGKMKEVANEGRTVLFVSHNMESVQALCDTALLLDGGQLIGRGDPMSMSARYLQMVRGDERCIVHHQTSGFRSKLVSARYTDESEMGAMIELKVECVADKSISDLCIDIGIDNEEGRRVLQFIPRFHHRPIDVDAGETHVFGLQAKTPHLKPGAYSITLYSYVANGQRLAHLAGIPGFTVPASADRAESMESGFTAPFIVPFELDEFVPQVEMKP